MSARIDVGFGDRLRAFAGRVALEVAAQVADAVAPRRCHLCGRFAADGLACDPHGGWWPVRGAEDSGAPWGGLGGPRCGHCLAALPAVFIDGAPCRACRVEGPVLDGGLALGEWRTPDDGRTGANDGIAPWIFALKYGGRRDVARLLGAALGTLLADNLLADELPADELLADELPADELPADEKSADEKSAASARAPVRLVPIPLHALRRFERGYDQAALLARAAAEALAGRGIAALSIAALRRGRSTRPQGSAFAAPRRVNVRGAFEPRSERIARHVRGHGVWLVDDVVSSAATVSAAARALRTMGAARVHLLILARGAGGGANR